MNDTITLSILIDVHLAT